ncbi:hypothetical protein HanOQP8_Chr17g0666071 [Helianthus annuus]|nr:hypothetical protein HanOQP8_Chr17g0666071 [Helianthus annuus]
MAGGHGYGNGTYKGVHLHQPKRWHTITGKGMCAMMWGCGAKKAARQGFLRCNKSNLYTLLIGIVPWRFWILYRAKQDGPVVLGWRHPWEGHGHEHGDEH